MLIFRQRDGEYAMIFSARLRCLFRLLLHCDLLDLLAALLAPGLRFDHACDKLVFFKLCFVLLDRLFVGWRWVFSSSPHDGFEMRCCFVVRVERFNIFPPLTAVAMR